MAHVQRREDTQNHEPSHSWDEIVSAATCAQPGGVPRGEEAPARAKALLAGPLSGQAEGNHPGGPEDRPRHAGPVEADSRTVLAEQHIDRRGRNPGGGPENVPAAAREKTAIDGKPTASICHHFSRSQPVTEWAALETLL